VSRLQENAALANNEKARRETIAAGFELKSG